MLLFDLQMQAEEQQKWVRGVREPFQGGRERFASIPKKDRSQHVKKILQTKQLPTPPPYAHQQPFPKEGEVDIQGSRVHYYSLEQAPSPQAVLIFIHGVNSHGGTFGYLADWISRENRGINIYAYDQTNFGHSAGARRGTVVSLEDSAREAQEFIKFIMDKFDKKPKVFLCGHSFGGAITLKLSLLSPQAYAGMLLLAPYLKDIEQSYYYTKRALKLIGWLFPNYRIAKSLPSGLGTKYTLTQKFLKDPGIFTGAIIPATTRAILNTSDEIYSSFETVATPFLCLAAGVEKLIDPFAALDLQERSPATDKRVIYCQDMWHVVVEEEEIDGIAWHCSQWLQERL